MRILIIGYSNIVQKRVLPALIQIPLITGIDIVSQSLSSKISLPEGFDFKIFDNYQTAILESKAELVYISTVNSEHAQWVEAALKKGLHVIVDKPAFTNIEDAIRLVDLSKKSNLCLAESTVYSYHPQLQKAKDVFLSVNSQLTHLTAIFSFPPLLPENFRYKKELGGGALLDLGVYAVTPGRIFFGEEPEEIFCRIGTISPEYGVETSFSVLITYSQGRKMIGHFSFTTQYCNRLNILGPGISIDIDRIFTTPADLENEIIVKQHNKTTILKMPKHDAFLIFLQKVIDNIFAGNYGVFAQDLLIDASVLHRMRLACNKE
ncbi:MAG: Gfo/Idh/MocA family oxidoreductase [bacterium]|nr:Gfo/Idh/MocA family oxidoreductase [bacterium]